MVLVMGIPIIGAVGYRLNCCNLDMFHVGTNRNEYSSNKGSI